jgi:hypothetical protein
MDYVMAFCLWCLFSTILDRCKCPEPPKPKPPVKYMDRAAERKWMPVYIAIAAARGDQTMVDHYRRVLDAAQKESP